MQVQRMFYSPFFGMLEQFWGLEGMFSGYWKNNPSLKLAFHPSQVMNTCPVCVCVMKEVPSLFCPVQKDVTWTARVVSVTLICVRKY